MKLIDLLTALGSDNINPKVNVTILNNDDTELITYNSGGYASVESDLGTKKVKRIKVNSATLVTVSIDNEDEQSNDPDPSNP